MSRQPCTRDCPDRAAGCHGKCKKYQEYRAEKEQDYKKRVNCLASSPDNPGRESNIRKRVRNRFKGYK